MAVGVDDQPKAKAGPALGPLELVFDLHGLQASCKSLRRSLSSIRLKRLKSRHGERIRGERRTFPPPAPATPGQAAVGLATLAAVLGTAVFLPWALTPLFIVFLLMAMPLRIYDYGWRHQGFNFFYLFDFCYWVNAAVGLVLLAPRPETLRGPLAAVYCLADGPVAAALLAWQCRWTVTSAEHTTSTLMHLLPGLATFAAWHLAPTGASTWPEYLGLPGRGVGAELLDAAPARQALWRLAAPLAFYAAWQVQYYAVVHVCCEGHIQRNGCDTSYRCLARRAKRAGNGLARLVLRGSTNRRIAVYGLLQAAFTVVTVLLVQPMLHSFWLAAAWQVAKVVIPLRAARRYRLAMRRRLAAQDQQRDGGDQSPVRLAAAAS